MLQQLTLAGIVLFAVVALASIAAAALQSSFYRAERRGSACTEFGTGR